MTSQASKALLLQIGTKWLPRTSRKFHPGFGWIALSLSLSIFFLSLSLSLSLSLCLSFFFFFSFSHSLYLSLVGLLLKPQFNWFFYLYLSIFDTATFSFFSLSIDLAALGPIDQANDRRLLSFPWVFKFFVKANTRSQKQTKSKPNANC